MELKPREVLKGVLGSNQVANQRARDASAYLVGWALSRGIGAYADGTEPTSRELQTAAFRKTLFAVVSWPMIWLRMPN